MEFVVLMLFGDNCEFGILGISSSDVSYFILDMDILLF